MAVVCLPSSRHDVRYSGPAIHHVLYVGPSFHTALGSLLLHCVNNVRIPWRLIYVSPGNKGMRQRSVSGDHLVCFLFPAHPLLTLIPRLFQKVSPLVAEVDNCSFIFIYVGGIMDYHV